MKRFYIISLKWTYPNSAAFTLWRDNNCGYCWYKDWAGVYDEEAVKEKPGYYDDKESTFAVDADVVDKLWTHCLFDGREVDLLFNTPEIRRTLGIKKKSLRGGMSDIQMRHVTVLKKAVGE